MKQNKNIEQERAEKAETPLLPLLAPVKIAFVPVTVSLGSNDFTWLNRYRFFDTKQFQNRVAAVLVIGFSGPRTDSRIANARLE